MSTDVEIKIPVVHVEVVKESLDIWQGRYSSFSLECQHLVPVVDVELPLAMSTQEIGTEEHGEVSRSCILGWEVSSLCRHKLYGASGSMKRVNVCQCSEDLPKLLASLRVMWSVTVWDETLESNFSKLAFAFEL